MNVNEFSRKLINYMQLSMCKTMKQLPFSGSHWLEQFMMSTAQYVLDERLDELHFDSKKPSEACRTFLNFMDLEGFLKTGDYSLEDSGDSLLVKVDRANCVYRDYCMRAPILGLPLYCARLSSFQAVLKHVLGKDFSASMETDEHGTCCGMLFPATQPKEEIVTREGHILKVAGRRAILLPQETYASLFMSIKEHAPHALKHVLYDAGFRSALNLARKTRIVNPNIEECLQLLLEVIKNDGLGNVELISFNQSEGRARIICYDSFQVSVANEYGSLYRSPQVTCDLLRGIFAAYFSVLLDREVICEEMSCQSVKGNYCEFLTMPLPKNIWKEEPSGGKI
ncbi:V4R domain-containing protein [Pelotomaculum propionicicum]|uniref:V4R domain-containing protein n=1 Tax=Pelotomaculum propionicicum TaxID=258475 RepID=UPI003B76299F